MTLDGRVWVPVGPSPMAEGASQDNGLVSAIAVSPANPNIIYIGTAGGGVWRSSDGGTTWIPIFDRQLSLAVGEPGALAIDPSNHNVVYVGTSARVSQQPAQGLFKSTDAGASWISLGSFYPSDNNGNAGQFVGQDINVIVVDPADGNVVYLAAANGVYRSTDGGQNWAQGGNAFGDARSLVLDASTPIGARTLYAGISGRGVFQSTDGGLNWNQILSGSTPAVSTAIGLPPGGFNKVVVDIAPPTSPPNPVGVQVLYCSLQGTGGAPDPVGLFQSTDGGATWNQRTATGMPRRTQGGYSFHLAVDPGSPGDGVNDIIFFGCVGQAWSTDAGASFTGVTGPHADTHAWAFVRQPSPTRSIVYLGCDGGINRSTDGGITWAQLNGGGLQTGLFYNIDIKPDATGSVTVGAPQDNGLQTTAGATAPGWNSPQGGDGWDIAYDAVTPGRLYGTSGFWPAPCTRVFVSNADGTDLPSTVPSSQDITPWGTTSDQACGVFPITTDPSTAGVVYVSGNQNLWQSQNAGGSWRILAAMPGTGNIDVARVDGNNVAIGVGTQVFLSTNALAATVGPPTGVAFTDITRNLPPRTVTRVAFDPNDPTVVYAVLGGFDAGPGNFGHVFRTTVTASSWTDISPAVDLPYSAIALDGSSTPSAIYVGTDLGVLRSVDGGSSWSVLDDIHFPRVPVLDLVIRNGLLRAGTYGRGIFSFVKPAGPAVAVSLEHDLAFGAVCQGPQYLTCTVFNVGAQDLIIDSVQVLMGSPNFSVLSTPATPLAIPPGEDIEFTVMYQPVAPGSFDIATIRIASNDPGAPFVDLTATGFAGVPTLASAIADGGDFGNVCVGSFADEGLTFTNSGMCPLWIFDISSSSSEFVVPSVEFFPLLVSPGTSIEIPIRFQPVSFGSKAATLTIDSNDPATPATIDLMGTAPAPNLGLMIANAGSFGNTCVGSFVDRPLTLFNAGGCTLSITGISSSSAEFQAPFVSSYPITVGPGGSIEVPIRYQPSNFGVQSGILTVDSDDPAGPATLVVSGNAPSGTIAVTGSTCFGGVKACCCAERTVSICNTGDCDLHVTSVGFSRTNKHWKMINSPFPATLHPGSCLGLVIRYKATEKFPRCCDLVIKSDDPVTPVKTLELLAYTNWNDCSCKRHCDDCRRGRCDKRHSECTCGDSSTFNCCDDEDEDDD